MTDSNSPYAHDASVTVMENEFKRDNYKFTGWNTASDGSGKSYSNKPGESAKPAESSQNIRVTVPHTGDDTSVFLWLALLVVGCGGFVGTHAFKKRRTIK